MKFLTKFVGECNEKDLPIIKDQWRNLMIERLEETLERPYQIEVRIQEVILHLSLCSIFLEPFRNQYDV